MADFSTAFQVKRQKKGIRNEFKMKFNIKEGFH